MKKLILHIGTGKTGTSSIQKYLDMNESSLMTQGIKYSNTFNGAEKHIWALICFMKNPLYHPAIQRELKKTNRSIQQIIENKLSTFEKEVRSFSQQYTECTTIISCEDLWDNQNFTIGSIKSLSDYFKDLFDHIQLIVYIRDPLSHAVSDFSEKIKAGWENPATLSAPANNHLIHHKERLLKWINNFSYSEINVLQFNRKSFYQGNLLSDFCCHADISQKNMKELTIDSNKSLSLTSMRYLWFLNQSYPATIKGKINPKRGNIANFFSKHFNDGSMFNPCESEKKEHEKYCKESNLWLQKNFFPDQEKLWEPSNKEISPCQIDLSDKSMIDCYTLEIIEDLWRKKKTRPLQQNI